MLTTYVSLKAVQDWIGRPIASVEERTEFSKLLLQFLRAVPKSMIWRYSESTDDEGHPGWLAIPVSSYNGDKDMIGVINLYDKGKDRPVVVTCLCSKYWDKHKSLWLSEGTKREYTRSKDLKHSEIELESKVKDLLHQKIMLEKEIAYLNKTQRILNRYGESIIV